MYLKFFCFRFCFFVFFLSSLKFYDVCINQSVGNKGTCLKVFKQRLSDSLMQDWKGRIAESSRAIFYSLFSNFEHQLYLEAVNVKKFRVAITKLRVSSHWLETEAGRWARPNRTPINERKCRYCNKREDEFHFLDCIQHVDLRKQYIKSVFGIDQIC